MIYDKVLKRPLDIMNNVRNVTQIERIDFAHIGHVPIFTYYDKFSWQNISDMLGDFT